MTTAPVKDWRVDGLTGLAGLRLEDLPSFEILYLDAVAAYALGPDAPEPPYTVEHGAQVVAFLLQSTVNARAYVPGRAPVPTDAVDRARQAVLTGAHDLAERGHPGLAQLVNRLISASVGELERQSGEPEEQVHALFRYGLLAVASGPANELDPAAADGIDEVFAAWDTLIGDGFVPPWRSPTPSSAG